MTKDAARRPPTGDKARRRPITSDCCRTYLRRVRGQRPRPRSRADNRSKQTHPASPPSARPYRRTSPPSRCLCRICKPPGTSATGNCVSNSPHAAAWSSTPPVGGPPKRNTHEEPSRGFRIQDRGCTTPRFVVTVLEKPCAVDYVMRCGQHGIPPFARALAAGSCLAGCGPIGRNPPPGVSWLAGSWLTFPGRGCSHRRVPAADGYAESSAAGDGSARMTM